MRTIKFRGKCCHSDAWAFGNLVDYGEDENPEIQGFDVYHEGRDVWQERSVERDTIGQFTGLHDKNGKEIYEGDIISSKMLPQIKHLIFYNEKQGKFMAGLYGKTNIYDFGVCGVDNPAWMAEKEVIGNIHDNPKLLENEKD